MALPLELLLSWCYPRYRASPGQPLLPEELTLKAVLRIAEKNKLSYLFCLRLRESQGALPTLCQDIIRQGEKNQQQQRQTLEFVASSLRDIPFLVIKTYKGVPYITWDIDIQVPEAALSTAVARLQESGARPLEHPGMPRALEARLVRPRGAVLRKEGLLEIDVYQDTGWPGWLCLDNSFLWESPITRQVAGLPCLVPRPGADFLLSLGHILFNHGDMHLLDFLYLQELRPQVAGPALEAEVAKYGWLSAYRELLKTMEDIEAALKAASQQRHPPRFPLLLPVGLILRSYWAVARNPTSRLPGSSLLNLVINALIKLATMLVYRGR